MGFLKPKRKKERKQQDKNINNKERKEEKLNKLGEETKEKHLDTNKKTRKDSNKQKQQRERKESKFKGMDRSQVISEIWQTYARKWKLRRGWVTVSKTGKVIIVNPHLHQYPQTFKEAKKGKTTGRLEKTPTITTKHQQPSQDLTQIDLMLDVKQKAKCRI